MNEENDPLPPSPVARAKRGNKAAAARRSSIPTQTSFRHMPPSAAVVGRIEGEVGKLARYFDGITSCRVVVTAPHRHHRSGRRYALRIELGVPRERLVTAHEPAVRPAREATARPGKSGELDASHKDIQVAIRDAFAAARRQLKEYVRRLHGEVKEHRAKAPPRLRADLAESETL